MKKTEIINMFNKEMSVPLPKHIILYKRSSKPLTTVVWIVIVFCVGCRKLECQPL